MGARGELGSPGSLQCLIRGPHGQYRKVLIPLPIFQMKTLSLREDQDGAWNSTGVTLAGTQSTTDKATSPGSLSPRSRISGLSQW